MSTKIAGNFINIIAEILYDRICIKLKIIGFTFAIVLNEPTYYASHLDISIYIPALTWSI